MPLGFFAGLPLCATMVTIYGTLSMKYKHTNITLHVYLHDIIISITHNILFKI
jgi:hypothetical protein